MSRQRFAGRRALVTGASRGIGAGIAERLAAEGADVAIVARTLDQHTHLPGSLTETAACLRRYGNVVAVIAADLTDETDRARVVPEAIEALGGHVEILVNNAAAAIYGLLAEFPLKRRRILFEANVFAPLDLAQAVVPAMVAAGEGWIVNVSSATARPWDGPPFATGPQGSTTAMYGASKAALNRVTNGLAVELDGTGVRVNTVEPRAAVLSEGAALLVGATLRPDQIEPLEAMVEAVVALCDCPPETTGRAAVSLDLLQEWGLTVHGLDGAAVAG
ncbi:MAG: SDR family NAD(P)-dependent oxidoreductase [Acidimicrobiales bacterium]|jgi:NAD(P)-dependent dehydrogenase (short-subunit alcohol dehydrogenase family)|nr:SDR family NAD(P)-dependent oxidoreductase [Acidimicrobiales bacterium]